MDKRSFSSRSTTEQAFNHEYRLTICPSEGPAPSTQLQVANQGPIVR